MKQDELQKILDNHELWLKDEGGERANLSGADLTRADLICADLSHANLSGANLSGADLTRADLICADLSHADLTGADLSSANLSHADLTRADLSHADLTRADLTRADLRGVDLSHADLGGAYLSDADLRYANLSHADLTGADLSSANLSHADLRGANIEQVQYDASTPFFDLQCPEEGSFVGWKKCQYGVIVKLLIPEDAKRSSATSRKCRASKAVVLEVIGAEEGLSQYDADFVYKVGEEVVADSFEDDRWNECSHGIHFFITRKEAENY